MDNKKVPRKARKKVVKSCHGCRKKKKTTTRTTGDNKVPRRARNGKEKTTTRTTINNKGQQRGFLAGLGKNIFYHE